MATKKTSKKTPAKKRMGRPPKTAGEPRTEWLRLRVSVSEKRQLTTNAAAAGMSLTEFLVVRGMQK